MARPGEGRRGRGRGGAESGERCQETASPEVGEEECQTVHSGPSVLLELKPLEPRMRFLFCRTIKGRKCPKSVRSSHATSTCRVAKPGGFTAVSRPFWA